MKGIFCFLLVIIVSYATASRPHFIASSKSVLEQSKLHGRDKRQAWSLPEAVNLTTFHVTSLITTRFVQTTVVATYVNNAKGPQDTTFSFQLTPESFISNFVITLDNETYEAEVVEKDEALKVFKDAKRHGNSAGYAREVGSPLHFAVDLNVAPGSSVTFSLTYEELLRRDKDLYTHTINIAPGQVVEDMTVDVFIIEPQGLRTVDAWWLPGTDNLKSSIESNFQEGMQKTALSFNPTAVQQRGLDPEAGLNGRIVVKYDVMNRPAGGEIQTNDGYFAHFITSDGLPPAPKTVVFVIDVSGSMYGSKIEQTKIAMASILSELRNIDRYNILVFSTSVWAWEIRPVQVTNETRTAGLLFVESLYASGGTNIHDSLVQAAVEFTDELSSFPVIVFMTDGVPSVGETNPDNILSAVTKAIGGNAALYCVGFGDDVDEFLLKRLATGNGGAYRKVADDDNAAVKMEGFFREVASPLLYYIRVTYKQESVVSSSVTQSEFISYFSGDEIVIAGQLDESYDGNALSGLVLANSADGLIEHDFYQDIQDMPWMPNLVENFTERIWAYLMIKELLVKEAVVKSKLEKAALRSRALELSLKYQLVTPLTALLFYTPGPNYQPARRPAAIRHTGIYQTSRVIGDPHFIIDIPNTNLTICFDVHGKDGTIVNLLTDPVHDILVNAKMIPFHFNKTKTKHSLFGRVGVKLGPHRIVLAHHQVFVDMEISHPWYRKISIILDKYNITIHDRENVTIRRGNDIVMRIQRRLWKGHPAHFDFYLERGEGLSEDVHGIIGQFQTKPMQLTKVSNQTTTGLTQATIIVRNKEENVMYKTNFSTRGYKCWWAKADNYLDGTTEQYIVPRLFDPMSQNIV